MQKNGTLGFREFLSDRQFTHTGTGENGSITGRVTGPVTMEQLKACRGSQRGCQCVCHRRYIDPGYQLPPDEDDEDDTVALLG